MTPPSETEQAQWAAEGLLGWPGDETPARLPFTRQLVASGTLADSLAAALAERHREERE